MKKILLVMQRVFVSASLRGILQSQPDISVIEESNYKMALLTSEVTNPSAALLEIPESGDWTASRCLNVCAVMHRHLPKLPILVLCPENNPEACKNTMEAKCRGDITDFVFYDASTQYILSKLITM